MPKTIGAPLEQEIQKQILDYLKYRGIFCWKNNTNGIYVRARNTYIPSHAVGVADIIGIGFHGQFMAIEVKRAGGKVSSDQRAFLDEVTRNGGLAIVAYSVEDVEKALTPKSTKMQPGVSYRI